MHFFHIHFSQKALSLFFQRRELFFSTHHLYPMLSGFIFDHYQPFSSSQSHRILFSSEALLQSRWFQYVLSKIVTYTTNTLCSFSCCQFQHTPSNSLLLKIPMCISTIVANFLFRPFLPDTSFCTSHPFQSIFLCVQVFTSILASYSSLVCNQAFRQPLQFGLPIFLSSISLIWIFLVVCGVLSQQF